MSGEIFVPKDLYWPCACTKRKAGVLSHIKLNHPHVKKCRRCKCARPDESEKKFTNWLNGQEDGK